MCREACRVQSRGHPDQFNARIPAVSIRNSVAINQLASPRLIMTHSLWRPKVQKAIYLIRDGRDAFISYYHYQTTRRGVRMGAAQFSRLYHDRVFGDTWADHVHSWLTIGRQSIGSNLVVVKFEDLKDQPETVISQLCRFLNIQADHGRIRNAVNHSSIENARQIERLRQGEISDANASFYRQGTSQQWQNCEYQSEIDKFCQASRHALVLAGYEPTHLVDSITCDQQHLL